MRDVGFYKDCLNEEEAFHYLGMQNVAELKEKVTTERIPHVRIAGVVWFPKTDLDAYLLRVSRYTKQWERAQKAAMQEERRRREFLR